MPYEFGGVSTVRKKLETGDYSVEGFEDKVAVERKTKEDAYGCVGASRDRFLRCLSRLGELERAAIVIESNMDEFVQPPPYSGIHPASALGSFISWCQRFRLCGPIWVPSREYGEKFTMKFLAAYLRDKRAESF